MATTNSKHYSYTLTGYLSEEQSYQSLLTVFINLGVFLHVLICKCLLTCLIDISVYKYFQETFIMSDFSGQHWVEGVGDEVLYAIGTFFAIVLPGLLMVYQRYGSG